MRGRTMSVSDGFEVGEIGLQVYNCLFLQGRNELAEAVKKRLDQVGDEANLALAHRD